MRDKSYRSSKESETKRRWREKAKKSKAKSTLLMETYWPKVIISRDARICISTVRNPKPATSSYCETKSSPPNETNDLASSEVIEHLCCEDNAASFEEEKTICRISSSTEIENGNADVYASCGDCIECKDEKRNVKIAVEDVELKEQPENNYVEQFEYANCNSEEYSTTVPSTIVSTTEEDEEPMFVDLTNDESKVPWKQTILKRLSDTKCFADVSDETSPEDAHYDSSDASEEHRIMIADSSSRLNRGTSGGSLATALRDRRSCVIPVQPNRSLPIRPAPPAPTRCTRKDRTPVLKLSNGMLLDVVQVDPIKSAGETDDPLEVRRRKGETTDTIGTPSFIIPQILSIEYLGGVKRKIEDNEGKEGRENQKRRRSHEADSSQSHENCVGDASKEAQRSFYESAIEEGGRASPEGMTEDVNEKRCASIVVSTTDDVAGRGKEIGNKVVPPLRLKKIIRAETEGYRSLEKSTETENESNYRIVTGATPQPDSRSAFRTITSSRNSVDRERNFNLKVVPENTRDNGSRRTPVKSDGYKLIYRRNRLRQKLRELRAKALELAEQMANSSTADNSSPYESTRLRQAMNRYEKQIENLSKLLNKLSTAAPMSNNVINVDDESEIRDIVQLNVADANEEVMNGEMITNSPSPSPEPPKLSPRSPLNYDENRSPKEVRNSPPVLPRVCLAISADLDPTNEDLQVTDESTWTIDETAPSNVMLNANALNRDTDSRVSRLNYDNANDHVEVIPPISSSTVDQESQCNVMETDVDRPNFEEQSRPVARSDKIIQCDENEAVNRTVREKETQSENATVVSEEDKVGCFNLLESENGSKGPIVNSVVGGAQVPASVRCEVFEPTTTSQRQQVLPPTMTNVSQSQSNCPGTSVTRNSVDDARNSQKVTSSSSQCVLLDCAPPSLPFTQVNAASGTANEQRNVLQKNCEADGVQNEFVQRKDDNLIMTEQFPTLGNWVARMSKKQVSKPKSKLQGAGGMLIVSTADNARIAGHEAQRKVPASTVNVGLRNNVVNVAPQWNNERWQRQQRQQQFLQQVVAPTAPVQPLPAAPPLRPNICPPISMTQFYPNSYAIDPYGGTALSYHSPMCPCGTYPYHTRVHPPLPSYHLPIQDTMRTLQHVDKRFPPLQDPIRHFPSDIIKYSSSLSTGTFQHPGNLEFDRLRGPSTNANVGGPSCLRPLLVPPPPPTLPSNPQTTLPRGTLGGYPTNNGQYSRNRMIPDVVAAAAAAAVVAAASLDRQHDATTYRRPENEVTSNASLPNVVECDATHASTATGKTVGGRETGNQEQNANDFGPDARLNTGGFQHIQNLLMDRLPFIREAGAFGSSGGFGADGQTSVVNGVPYKVAGLGPPRGQSSRDVTRNSSRSCETPHLGKVSRSPNTLNSLACSTCGLTGSMFKCLGCESAFYCDERCQARHWTVHVERCPKKMPRLKKVA